MSKIKEARKRLYEACKRHRICYRCRRSEVAYGLTICRGCWYKRAAARHLGDSSRAEELEALLLRQRYRCAYTGVKLIPGRNASVDHIRPVARNARRSADITNLCWCEVSVNLMKCNQPLNKFIALCKLILKTQGYKVTR